MLHRYSDDEDIKSVFDHLVQFIRILAFSTNMTITSEVHIVPELPNRKRLPEYAIGVFVSAATKSALKKAIKKNWITVDDKQATTATFVNGGECIRLTIPEEAALKRTLNLSLDVLYEDDHLAVIEKPAGIPVSGNQFRNIANALQQNLSTSPLKDATLPQPVHRLDYATTGVLLIGKTSSSIRALNKLFENKGVEKIYYAITIGDMQSQGTITTDIDGKKSFSNYEVLDKVASSRFGQLNLVKLTPKTGRRHQLRIHLSMIGHPILGDKEYGVEGLVLKGKGLYLHAYSLRFIHPFTQEEIYLRQKLPNKFLKIFPLST